MLSLLTRFFSTSEPLNAKTASFHSYAVGYFTTFDQSLLDFFKLVDFRLMLMREAIKLYECDSLLRRGPLLK